MSLLPHFRPLSPGSLRFEIFECIRYCGTAVTPKQVITELGYAGLESSGKQRKTKQIQTLMAAMVETGHLRKVGARLYTTWNDRRKDYVPVSLKDALVAYLRKRGQAEIQQLVKHFKEHSEGSIRTTLYLLQRANYLKKTGDSWACARPRAL